MSRSTPLTRAHPIAPTVQSPVSQTLQQPSLLNAGVSLYHQLQKNAPISAPSSISSQMVDDNFPTEHLVYTIPQQQQQQRRPQQQEQQELAPMQKLSRRPRSPEVEASESKRQQQIILNKMRRDISRLVDTLYEDVYNRSDIQPKSHVDDSGGSVVSALLPPPAVLAQTASPIVDNSASITAQMNALQIKFADLSSQVASITILNIIIVVGVVLLLVGTLIYLCFSACRKL